MNFADRIIEQVERFQHPIVVGIDPHLHLLPKEFEVARNTDAPRAERADALARFGCDLIDAIADKGAIVKPQSAFFEVLGADGVAAWERVLQHAHAAGMTTIGDVKRGDISSTARAYAEAHLGDGPGRCDSVTLSPYLGDDSIEPFLPFVEDGAGIFVLVRTSNPGSAGLQQHGNPSVAQRVAAAVHTWGESARGEHGWSSVGAVVGATHPNELAAFRASMPNTLLLLPGVGAQGAGPKDVVAAFSDPKRPLQGALINSSRGISFAYTKRTGVDWQIAAREALTDLASSVKRALLTRA